MQQKSIFILFLFFLISTSSFAQQRLKGIVKDKTTGLPVPFATIQAKNAKKSLTNENGQFEIEVSGLPASLAISHLNYHALHLKTGSDQSLSITLIPQVLTLKEVSVGNPAIAIMQEVSDKARKTAGESHYGKAFIRQIAYEGERPTYMNEIFFEADWKAYTMSSWHPTQARSLKGKSLISYDNLSYLTFILSGYLGNNHVLKPLTRKVDSLYQLKLLGTYELNGQEIAKINCIPKYKIKHQLSFEGIYYVNTVSNEVLKMEGNIRGVKISGGGPLGFKNKFSTFTAQFKQDEHGDNVLDYVVFNTSNLLKVLGVGAKTTDLYTTLYMVDQLPVNKDNLKEINGKINDQDMVKATVTGEAFWKNNQGIIRTEKEQNAIEILEKIPQVKK
ncbi:carboxypeptidase-like regulatory domain-containing protein [Pedobacter sp. AW31-3R]|uniref:carboxypeptidase-like regulatory domain-containing protein n=1 Tax=Pedobacter sp. AW31-3R TaxID=3445781 RepID=UPI003FA139E4